MSEVKAVVLDWLVRHGCDQLYDGETRKTFLFHDARGMPYCRCIRLVADDSGVDFNDITSMDTHRIDYADPRLFRTLYELLETGVVA